MKLKIKKLTLQSAVEKCASLVAGACREIAPVLKNFHLEAREGSLRVVATDTDLTVIADTSLVVVEEAGDAIIPAKMLWDIVKECDDVDINLDVTDSTAHITTPTTTWDVQLMKEKYPQIPQVGDLKWIVLNAKEFGNALRKVRPAVAKDLNRPELTLVKCHSVGVEATDGPRLHFARFECKQPVEIQVGAVDELLKILRRDIDDQLRIAQTDTHILFKIGNDVFLSTRLQVHYPPTADFQASVNMNSLEMQVDRTELLNAVKRVRITADEETNRIILKLSANKLVIETRDKANNQARETVQVHWTYPDREFSLNWVFLRDAVEEMESPNVVLVFGENKGVRLAPVAVREENFTAIINQLNVVNQHGKPQASSANVGKSVKAKA